MRIGIYLGLPMWGGGGRSTPPEPPVEFEFQEFDMTAGGEGQWVGYSVGTAPAPQPAFGSISNQPTAVTALLAFYDDTASGVFLAAFAGDYVEELDGVQLSIGGLVVDSFEVELISGTTWVRFTGIPGDLTPGAVYEVSFGWDLTIPAPIFTTQPSISGTQQSGQALTAADGTASNTTVYTRQWLRGTTAISGATGATYVLTNDDVGANISLRVTAIGPGGSTQATSNTIGPITDGASQPSLMSTENGFVLTEYNEPNYTVTSTSDGFILENANG